MPLRIKWSDLSFIDRFTHTITETNTGDKCYRRMIPCVRDCVDSIYAHHSCAWPHQLIKLTGSTGSVGCVTPDAHKCVVNQRWQEYPLIYIYIDWIACGVCSIIVWFADNVPPSLCSTSACAVQIQLFQSYSAGVLRHVCAAMQWDNA